MLHILKNQQSIHQALPYIQSEDCLILIEDSVYCANKKHECYPSLADFHVYVLREDLEARGLQSFVAEDVDIVDYSGFVHLTATNTSLMTWN
ncbi:sulfurtransferase complex subunit TusB [Vibrio sp. PP-XX7]